MSPPSLPHTVPTSFSLSPGMDFGGPPGAAANSGANICVLRMTRWLTLLVLWLLPAAAFAFEGENLLVSVPPGYKIDFQRKSGKRQISEMVPTRETVQNWTEMVTVQVYNGLTTVTPEQFRERAAQGWMKACAKATGQRIASATENGYPVALWLLSCPLNKQTGKPEITFMKAIGGKDSFYVVQKAFKFQPSRDQIATWMRYLKRVAVCDTRVPARACPAGIR